MIATSTTNCYDRGNYGPPNEPQIGHFSPNFHNLPSFSGMTGVATQNYTEQLTSAAE